MKKFLLSCLVALACISAQAQFFGVDTDKLNTLFNGLNKLPHDNAVMILKSTMNTLSNDPKAYRKAVEIIERMGNPADSLHNEVLYTEGLKTITSSFVLGASELDRPKLLLEMAQKNNSGSKATDIQYVTADGNTHHLLDGDKPKLIFFNDLDCDACTKAKQAMAASQTIKAAVEQGKLQVIAIYTGTSEKAWKKAEYPAWVTCGWDKTQQVEGAEAYVLPTTPLFYLLNSDNTVLIKNEPSLSRMEKAVEAMTTSTEASSIKLAKLLYSIK